MKKCFTCRALLPLGNFHRNKNSSDGFISTCKSCRTLHGRKKSLKLKPSFPDFQVCTQCKISKASSLFSKDAWRVSGIRGICKECDSVLGKNYRVSNPEIAKKFNKKFKELNPDYFQKWNKENSERRNEEGKNRYYANHEEERKKKNEWKKGNKGRVRALSSKRRKLIRGLPIPEEHEKIVKIYEGAPVGYEVDHIIPIINKNVCGLNVSWNLQYLTQFDNRSKGNKFDGTYENEYWKRKRD